MKIYTGSEAGDSKVVKVSDLREWITDRRIGLMYSFKDTKINPNTYQGGFNAGYIESARNLLEYLECELDGATTLQELVASKERRHGESLAAKEKK